MKPLDQQSDAELRTALLARCLARAAADPRFLGHRLTRLGLPDLAARLGLTVGQLAGVYLCDAGADLSRVEDAHGIPAGLLAAMLRGG